MSVYPSFLWVGRLLFRLFNIHHFLQFSPSSSAKTWLTAVPRWFPLMCACVFGPCPIWCQWFMSLRCIQASWERCHMIQRSAMCPGGVWTQGVQEKARLPSCYCTVHQSQLLIKSCLFNCTWRSIMQLTADLIIITSALCIWLLPCVLLLMLHVWQSRRPCLPVHPEDFSHFISSYCVHSHPGVSSTSTCSVWV